MVGYKQTDVGLIPKNWNLIWENKTKGSPMQDSTTILINHLEKYV